LEGLYDDVMEQFDKEVNKILNPILKKVNLDINLDELVGLDKIEKEIKKIRRGVDIELFNLFDDNLFKLDKNMDKLSAIVKS